MNSRINKEKSVCPARVFESLLKQEIMFKLRHIIKSDWFYS